MRRRLRLALRIGLGLLAGLLVLSLALLLALRTPSGRRALVRLALPIVNRILAGHVALSSIEGDLIHTIVIHDLEIDDAEGVQALYACRIAVRFDLFALRQRRLQIDDLAVEGGKLLVRHLKDDRVNFAALGKPSPVGTRGEPPSSKEPLQVVIAHARLQLDAGYDPPRGHEAHHLERPRGSFDIEAGVTIRGGEVALELQHLISDSRDPLITHVELSGGLKVTPAREAGRPAELTFERVALSVSADGSELQRIHPALRAAGRWQAHLTGSGTLSKLTAQLLLDPPAGRVTIDGSLARTASGLTWAAHALGSGLSPSRDWRGLAPGRVDFDIDADGAGRLGKVTLGRLEVAIGDLKLRASGDSDFVGTGRAEVTASAGDLASLAMFGVPGLAGRVGVTARLQRRGAHTTVAATIDGRELALAGLEIARVDARLHSEGEEEQLFLDAQSIRMGALALSALSLSARAQRDGSTGADVVLERLQITRDSHIYRLPSPATIRLSGSLEAPALDAELAGVRLRARGHRAAAGFVLDVDGDAPDLSSLGVADLTGRLDLAAHVTKDAHLTVDADVHGRELRSTFVHLHALDLHLQAKDMAGSARLSIDDLDAPGLRAETLVLETHSDADRIELRLSGRAPGERQLVLAADGHFLRRGGAAVGADVIVRALRLDARSQTWQLEHPASIRYDDALVIKRLSIVSGSQALTLGGSYRPSVGGFDMSLVARDIEPASFARIVGLKDALSDTTVNGRVHLGGTLAAPLLQVAIKATSPKSVAWYGLAFDTASITADADRQGLRFQLGAWGQGAGRMELTIHGAPLWQEDELIGAEATVDRLSLSGNGHAWQIGAPCRLRLDTYVALEACKVVTGKEEIILQGRVPLFGVDKQMDATVVTHALDLRKLGAFLAPGHKEPPTTSFNSRLHATGTRSAPVLDLELRGIGSQVDEGLPENVDYRIRAHYGGGHVDGEVSARQLGTKLGIGARFDLPTSFAQADERPLSFELEARPVPFFKFRDTLPPAIAGLRGFFSLRVRAAGTTRRPTFSVELHAPSWNLDDLSNNDTVLNLSYDGDLMQANSVTSFATTSFLDSLFRIHPQRNTGTIKLELKARLDLGRLLAKPRELPSALQHFTPLTATAEVKGVELQSIPLQIIGIATPFTSGRVDGAVKLSGTLDEPSLHANLHAMNLGKPGLLDRVDVTAAGAFDQGLAQVSGQLSLRDHVLLVWKGELHADARKLFDGDPWKDGAAQIDVELPAFDLALLRGMQPRLRYLGGTLRGKGRLRGSLARPELEGALAVRELRLGGAEFSQAKLDARYRDGRFTLGGRAEQAQAGRIAVDAAWSRDVGKSLELTGSAEHLDLGFLTSATEDIDFFQGILDGKIALTGTREHPTLEGQATVDQVKLGLRGQAQQYDGGKLELGVHRGRADVMLKLAAGAGSLDVRGHAQIDGLRPMVLELDTKAKHFTLAYGSLAAVLDADFGVHGDCAAGTWTGLLDLHRGSITLPDLAGTDQAQPLGQMADVRYGDQRAGLAPPRLALAALVAGRVSGPLQIRSRELSVDLQSEVAISSTRGNTTATGDVEGVGGTVELFGKNYALERARIHFTGNPDDPELQMRATRRAGTTTLIVGVSGTARHPEVTLTAEPPLYDPAQLASLLLASSSKGDERLSFQELNEHIGGILSTLILQKLKAQMGALLPVDIAPRSYAGSSLTPLEVGRFISDRVYVSYAHQFGSPIGRSAANSNESQVNYRLSRHGELETAVGDAGVAGVYLYWTFKY